MLITIVGGYYQFKPKLSLEVEPPLKAEADINVPFRIKNDGVLAIYDVKQEWKIDLYRLQDDNGAIFEASDVSLSREAEDVIPIIQGGKSATLYPMRNFEHKDTKITHMELTVVITYRAAIFGVKKDRFGLETQEGADGAMHWYHTSR